MKALPPPRPRSAAAVLLIFCVLPLFARDQAKKLVGTYKGETRTREETRAQSRENSFAIRHHTIALSLGPDGGATLTQSPDAVSETTSFAHWKYGDGRVTLTFEPASAGADPSAPVSFQVKGSELLPVTWDRALWKGLPPPVLHRQ